MHGHLPSTGSVMPGSLLFYTEKASMTDASQKAHTFAGIAIKPGLTRFNYFFLFSTPF